MVPLAANVSSTAGMRKNRIAVFALLADSAPPAVPITIARLEYAAACRDAIAGRAVLTRCVEIVAITIPFVEGR